MPVKAGETRIHYFELADLKALSQQIAGHAKNLQGFVDQLDGAKFAGALGVDGGREIETKTIPSLINFLAKLEKEHRLVSVPTIGRRKPNGKAAVRPRRTVKNTDKKKKS